MVREIHEDYNMTWDGEELEYASISDSIQHSEYKILDDCRDKRNNIIYELERVSVFEAEKLDLIVSKLVVREINHRLIDTDLSIIEFEPRPVMHRNQFEEAKQKFEEIQLM